MKSLFFVLYVLFQTTAHADSVEAVLARMDREAPSFRALSADVKMKSHTAVIDDTTEETGTLNIQRQPGHDTRAILDFTGPADPRTIGFLGKIIRIYYPKLNSYQDYQLGNSTDVVNQFLLLGFGSSGKDLRASYSIQPEGEEQVNGIETTKLALTPKSPEVLKRLSKVEVWIPVNGANPVQQEFYAQSGDYRIVTYSNINLKPNIKGELKLKLPSSAKRQGG